MMKIGTARGYTILYDEKRRLFILEDAEGNEIASGQTQDEVEAKAEKFSKQAFKVPILALRVSGLNLYKGRVTSVNTDDKSAYFVYADKEYGSHTKLSLRYDHAYELTEANAQITGQVEECRRQITEIEKNVKSLIGQLEKPINLAYFGLKEAYCPT